MKKRECKGGIGREESKSMLCSYKKSHCGGGIHDNLHPSTENMSINSQATFVTISEGGSVITNHSRASRHVRITHGTLDLLGPTK